MERIPGFEGLPFCINIYQASSLSDMLHSRSQVIGDMRVYMDSLPMVFKAWCGVSEIPTKAACTLLGREYHYPTGALVYIPVVRHFPEKDPAEDLVKLIDPTAEVVAKLPDRFHLELIKRLGGNMDPKSAKRLSWCSDVVLANSYSPFGDKYNLVHISNRSVREKKRQGAFEFMRNFVTEGMGVR